MPQGRRRLSICSVMWLSWRSSPERSGASEGEGMCIAGCGAKAEGAGS